MKTSFSILLIFVSSILFSQTKEDTIFLKQKADEAYEMLYTNLDSARILAKNVVKVAKKKNVFIYQMDALSTVGDSYFYNYNFEKALSIFKDGYQIAKQKQDTLIQAKFINSIAMVYEQLADYQNAARSYSKSLTFFISQNDSIFIPAAYGNLSNVYTSLGNLDSAIICQKKAIAIRIKLQTPKIHTNYNNIGVCYHELGRFDKAIEYYLKAATIRREQEEYLLEAATYGNLSSLFSTLKDHDNCIKYANNAIDIYIREKHEDQMVYALSNLGTEYKRIKEYDLAISYYGKALAIDEKTKNRSNKAIDLHNLGAVYEELNQLEKALIYYQKALSIKEEIEKEGSSIITIINIGNVLSVLQKADSAELYLLKGYEKAIELKMLNEQKEASEKLADHYERLGNYKLATVYRKKESVLTDSLFNKDYTNKMNQLFVSYETTRTKNELLSEQVKSQSLEKQKAEAELRVLEKSKYLWLLGGGVLLLILSSSFLFYSTKQKQKSKLAQIRIEEQQKSLAAIIQAQEEERKRIAKDLHDGIVQQLGGLKLGLQKVFADKQTSETKKIIKILDDSAQELRELSHKMMPRSLSELGLIPALEDMLENSLGHSAIHFQFEHFGIKERFQENIEIAIYRIAQELINNIIKHSHANKVNVQLIKTGNHVLLIVEDNGKGMNINEQKSGIGLMNISSRLDTLNGKVNFEPSPKSGTLATIKIPIS